jgi:hypothetical protein
MITICTLLIIFLSIQSRNYETIYQIRTKLFPKFHDISIKFEIQGKNDYSYKFESQNILYTFTQYYVSDFEKNIIMRNQKMELIFNFSIYEVNDKIFNYFSNDIVHTELIKVGILFQQLRFYQAKSDFSFDIKYKIQNIDDDMVIIFDNMNEANPFKYLLFEDKDELYENKTLYDLMKIKIVDHLIEGMSKILLTYPECDQLYHFNSLVQYFTNNQFEIDFNIGLYTYYRANINYMEHGEIKKIGDILQLENIITRITLLYYNDYGIGVEDYNDSLEIRVISFEYINIHKNLTIEFGELTKGEIYVFDILKQIINKIKL